MKELISLNELYRTVHGGPGGLSLRRSGSCEVCFLPAGGSVHAGHGQLNAMMLVNVVNDATYAFRVSSADAANRDVT